MLNNNMNFKPFFHKFLLEDFDNISKLLLSPENKHKTWNELMDEFEKEGGKLIGQGKYGKVLYHPAWKYVLKIFPKDDCYLRFVRWALAHPSSALPKFYDKPRKVIPYYSRQLKDETLYIVRTEELWPVTWDEYKDVDYILHGGKYTEEEYNKEVERTEKIWAEIQAIDIKNGRNYNRDKSLNDSPIMGFYKRREEIIKKYPNMEELYKVYNDLRLDKAMETCDLDLHRGNIMKRQNGELVFIDLLWEGESIFAAADRAYKMEIDYYGNDFSEHEIEEPESLIKGGEKWKAPKPKKLAPPQPLKEPEEDDVPF